MTRAAASVADRGTENSTGTAWPDDAVEVGRIAGAWGVKGWIKVQPHADDPQGLLRARPWFVEFGGAGAATEPQRRTLAITQAKPHGEFVVAAVAELADRDAAEALRGGRVFVSRAAFPPAQRDEYYWVDLVGAAVVNRQGQPLGTVRALLDTGVHSVLCVTPAEAGREERLIPFVSAYVDAVDLDARRIVVDWALDY